jgi:hypothetical protein
MVFLPLKQVQTLILFAERQRTEIVARTADTSGSSDSEIELHRKNAHIQTRNGEHFKLPPHALLSIARSYMEFCIREEGLPARVDQFRGR